MPKGSMTRTYFRYIIPSTVAFVLEGVYTIVDGLFVGNAVGDAGITGINVAWPLIALVMAIGTGIGMGGAVISSVFAGEGDEAASKRAIGHTLTMLLVVTPPVMIMLFAFGQPLLFAMGGRDEILYQAQLYLSVIAWGAVLQLLAAGFVPIIRNRGKVVFAMVALGLGGALNMLLDYVLVILLDWGVVGAALGTIASQAVVLAFCVWFFVQPENRIGRKDLGMNRSFAARALRNGFAPFALTILPEVTTIVLNVQTQALGGGTAQAAFAIISYIVVSIQWAIQGIGDGSQPLVSTAYGAGNGPRARAIRNANYLLAAGIGVVGIAVLFAFRGQISSFFGISAEASAVFSHGVVLFSSALVFYGLTHASTAFFYAVESGKSAIAVVVLEACFIVAYANVLPLWLGLDGVWLSLPATQASLALLCFVLLKAGKRNLAGRLNEQRKRRDRNASA